MEDCDNCKLPGLCGKCLQGGLPMKKELTTVVALVFLGLSVVLGILLVSTKRQVLQLSGTSSTGVAIAIPKTAILPAPRTYNATIALPAPKLNGTMSVEQALESRRSR